MKFNNISLSHRFMTRKEREIGYVHDLWLRTLDRCEKYREIRLQIIDDIIKNVELSNNKHKVYGDPTDDGYIPYYEITKSTSFKGSYRVSSSTVDMNNREEKLDYSLNFLNTKEYYDKYEYYNNIGYRCVYIVKDKLMRLIQDKLDSIIDQDTDIFLSSMVINISGHKYILDIEGSGNRYKKVNSISHYREEVFN